MLIDKIKIGTTVYVSDYSYSVCPHTLKPNFNYTPFAGLAQQYVVIDKGRFPGHTFSKLKKTPGNNIRIKRVDDGEEFYIKAQFLRKVGKNERITVA